MSNTNLHENYLQKSGKVPIFQKRVRKFHHKIHVTKPHPLFFEGESEFLGPRMLPAQVLTDGLTHSEEHQVPTFIGLYSIGLPAS